MSTPSVRPASALDTVTDTFVEARLRLDPVEATFAGAPGHDDRLTDLSPEGHAARADAARAALIAADAAVLVDDVDRDTLAALHDRLGTELALHEAGLHLRNLNNIASPVQYLRDVFDVAPTETPAQWADIATRLTAMPQALQGYTTSLRLAIDEGWRPPRRQLRLAADQARSFAGPRGFFTSLPDQAPEGADVEKLREGARAAARAYGDLADLLTGDLARTAREDDAVGRDEYALHSRAFLGTSVDLDETYAWGLEELDRLETRMAHIADALTPDAVGDAPTRIAAACDALDADPTRRIEGAEAFRDWMQQLADRALAELGGTHFDIPEPVRTLVCRIAPSSSGSVYYTPPSEDFSRPGQMWWSVTTGRTSFSTWQETSTVFHEGVPGHHLQCGVALAQGATLNRWRRLFAWTSGHGEGWALYAERLMEELGHLDDPGDLMGMLDAHALRAARVVVDIGVHCGLAAPAEVGGGVWDAEKAWTFLRRHTRTPDDTLRFELDRYLGWPGQAPSYKIGERIWLQLRDEAKHAAESRGEAFDLRAFHDDALRLGSVGLDVLRAAVRLTSGATA